MATSNVSNSGPDERIAQKAYRRGMRVNTMYGRYAVTFSPERIEQLRYETGKLNPGVIAMCGTLNEVDQFLRGVNKVAE